MIDTNGGSYAASPLAPSALIESRGDSTVEYGGESARHRFGSLPESPPCCAIAAATAALAFPYLLI